MKNETIIDAFIRTCHDGYEQGWHERNGGNLTYHLDKAEVESIKNILKPLSIADHHALSEPFKELAGETFITTASGKFMRNAPLFPEETLGVIRIDDDGAGYSVLWGLVGGKPTSELPSHLLNHIHRCKVNPACKVIYHSHPANITALSYTIEPDAKTLTKILWQSETECAVVFPEGVGIVPWMIPGGMDIARATSRLIEHYPAVVWSFHGIFCSGATLDEAFGLTHTIEKAAEIYLKAKAAGIIHTITDDDLRVLAKAFGVTLNPEFID